ncbi:MAG: hypothetical protein OHK0017_11650 [Patescibacteria group bacterium]
MFPKGYFKYLITSLGLFAVFFANLPISVQAHITGLNHHETRFSYDTSLKLSYILTIFYTDFESVYKQIDSNSDGNMDSVEAKKWLDSWKNQFSVESQGSVYNPTDINIITKYNEVKDNAYPLFRFDLRFSNLKLSQEFSEFKIINSYRISKDLSLEDWVTNFDSEVLEEQGVEVRSGELIQGKWKLKQDPTVLAAKAESTSSPTSSGTTYGASQTLVWYLDPKFWVMALGLGAVAGLYWWFKSRYKGNNKT